MDNVENKPATDEICTVESIVITFVIPSSADAKGLQFHNAFNVCIKFHVYSYLFLIINAKNIQCLFFTCSKLVLKH